jgi:hypothetical protein
MKYITRIVLALGVTASSFALARVASADEAPWHCYITVGSNLCAQDGTPEAAAYAADQARYFASFGQPDPGPQPTHPGFTVPGTPTTAPKPCRTFTLAGGDYCYVEGTAEYEAAVEMERKYLEFLNSGALAPTITTAPSPETGSISTPAPDAAPEVVVIEPETAESVESTTTTAAPAPTITARTFTLPDTR